MKLNCKISALDPEAADNDELPNRSAWCTWHYDLSQYEREKYERLELVHMRSSADTDGCQMTER